VLPAIERHTSEMKWMTRRGALPHPSFPQRGAHFTLGVFLHKEFDRRDGPELEYARLKSRPVALSGLCPRE